MHTQHTQMKKLVLIFLVLGTIGCSVMVYKPKYNIGMTEQEFVNLNKRPEKVFADDLGITIYRTNNGMQSMYAFFVFEKSKLIRYEEGKDADDFRFIRL